MTQQKKTPKKDKIKVPAKIFANASPLSVSGVSMFDVGNQINTETVANFHSEDQVIYRAIDKLEQAGFDVLQASRVTINIAGSLKTYEKAFNTKIVSKERPVIKPGAVEDTATFWEPPETDIQGLIPTKGTSFEEVLEGVAIEEPVYYMAESMFPPTKEYWHLRMPGDVSLGCNADRAHRTGITGKGVKVAMADTGWYKHPYFIGRGYRAAPVVLGPSATNALKDEVGHGTGESANIFAVAPDVQLLPVKMSFVNSLGAFNAAVNLNPDIITCSWGSSIKFGPLSAANQAMAAAIANAVAAGIIVVFSAGNGHWGFPGQHPDVISAGGVYMKVDESLQASDYASGFMSNIYPNRRVPDLSGLVGMKPKAIYIMLPLEPGDSIDVGNAGGTHPAGDETASKDGWAAFSGTSAAAPQLAGAAALIKQACPKLTPPQVRSLLMKSARDVTAGKCNTSTGANPATVGPDTATGNGLVDAQKAVLLAKIGCLGIITPPVTIMPPTTIIPPTTIKPPAIIEPPRIVDPIPIKPPTIIEPPIGPGPRDEKIEDAPIEAEQKPPLSVEDITALEDLILGSELDEGDL